MSKSIPRARHLRRNQTTAEAKLWRVLRNRALNGWKFRRQYPIDRFIVDFACVEARLVVEVDGATHSTDWEIHSDAARTAIIEASGFVLLRILNADIHQDLDGVRETIWAALPPGDPV
ncbi:endonuclease domain-containing protein [Methylobacterium sp. E-066]|uniref:endonuclease domain-containing protein n=1 Tax=Methylobacterium sp. E-066 TaxID=2836584 RepID=UPI001FBB4CC5|nr:DUF559 domain-containing protein [Methylobacterium sp. E-066]MCJ2138806.1 DUF559 domain-containing protein [Methylobacterium sp. E-066]